MGEGVDPRMVHWGAWLETEAGSLSINWRRLSVNRHNFERSACVFGLVRFWFDRVL
jgi:hypothetical protein